MSLYEDLGVPKDASAEEVRRAYRRLAQRHHPDRSGGDAELFLRIQSAYDVLGSKDRRALYDRTGKTNAQDQKSEMMKDVVSLFLSLISTEGFDEAHTDLIASAKSVVNQKIESDRSRIRNMESEIARHERVVKRLRKKTAGENAIVEMLVANIDASKIAVEHAKQGIEEDKMILTVLDEYAYDVDLITPGSRIFDSLRRETGI